LTSNSDLLVLDLLLKKFLNHHLLGSTSPCTCNFIAILIYFVLAVLQQKGVKGKACSLVSLFFFSVTDPEKKRVASTISILFHFI